MDSRVVIDETSPLGGTGGAVADPEECLRLKKQARRMGVLAVVACPCHLPLVATILALVGFGGSAAALRDNLVVVLGVIAVASLWLAVRSTRAGVPAHFHPRRRRAVSPSLPTIALTSRSLSPVRERLPVSEAYSSAGGGGCGLVGSSTDLSEYE